MARYRRITHFARLDYLEEENEEGVPVPCIYAECEDTGESIGPIWGHGDASRKRALATLAEKCDGSWHSTGE